MVWCGGPHQFADEGARSPRSMRSPPSVSRYRVVAISLRSAPARPGWRVSRAPRASGAYVGAIWPSYLWRALPGCPVRRSRSLASRVLIRDPACAGLAAAPVPGPKKRVRRVYLASVLTAELRAVRYPTPARPAPGYRDTARGPRAERFRGRTMLAVVLRRSTGAWVDIPPSVSPRRFSAQSALCSGAGGT